MSNGRKDVERCGDCRVESGQRHELFCTKERCPFCGGQLAACSCMFDVLELNDEERRAVEEYVDDSVEPLLGIRARWVAALEREGRIPFKPPPANDPGRIIHSVLTNRAVDARVLRERGVTADVAREDGYTLLMAAALKERLDLVTNLLDAGADANARTNSGESVLRFALKSQVGQHEREGGEVSRQAECVRMLLQRGADPNEAKAGVSTPLMDAAWWGALDASRVLLESGADPTPKDAQGRSALSIARERGHQAIVALLEEKLPRG